MAKEPSDIAETAAARFVLDQSEDLLRNIIVQMQAMVSRIEASEEVTQSEVSKVVSNLNQNRSRLIDEVSKHENRILIEQKRVAHAPLDFDELRLEIGRKIDRIRNAIDPDGGSEESDG